MVGRHLSALGLPNNYNQHFLVENFDQCQADLFRFILHHLRDTFQVLIDRSHLAGIFVSHTRPQKFERGSRQKQTRVHDVVAVLDIAFKGQVQQDLFFSFNSC